MPGSATWRVSILISALLTGLGSGFSHQITSFQVPPAPPAAPAPVAAPTAYMVPQGYPEAARVMAEPSEVGPGDWQQQAAAAADPAAERVMMAAQPEVEQEPQPDRVQQEPVLQELDYVEELQPERVIDNAAVPQPERVMANAGDAQSDRFMANAADPQPEMVMVSEVDAQPERVMANSADAQPERIMAQAVGPQSVLAMPGFDGPQPDRVMAPPSERVMDNESGSQPNRVQIEDLAEAMARRLGEGMAQPERVMAEPGRHEVELEEADEPQPERVMAERPGKRQASEADGPVPERIRAAKITDNVDITGLKNFNDFTGNSGLMQAVRVKERDDRNENMLMKNIHEFADQAEAVMDEPMYGQGYDEAPEKGPRAAGLRHREVEAVPIALRARQDYVVPQTRNRKVASGAASIDANEVGAPPGGNMTDAASQADLKNRLMEQIAGAGGSGAMNESGLRAGNAAAMPPLEAGGDKLQQQLMAIQKSVNQLIDKVDTVCKNMTMKISQLASLVLEEQINEDKFSLLRINNDMVNKMATLPDMTRKAWQEKTSPDMMSLLKTSFQQMEAQAKQIPPPQNRGLVFGAQGLTGGESHYESSQDSATKQISEDSWTVTLAGQSGRLKTKRRGGQISAADKLSVSRDNFKEFETHRRAGKSNVDVQYYGTADQLPGGSNSSSLLDPTTYAGDPAGGGGKGGKDPAVAGAADDNQLMPGKLGGGKGGGAADYSQLMKLAGKMVGGGKGPARGLDYAENGRVPSLVPEAMGPMDYPRDIGQDYADIANPAADGGKKKSAPSNLKAPGNATSLLSVGKNSSAANANTTAPNATKAGTNTTVDGAAVAISNNATGAAPKNASGADNASAAGAKPANDVEGPGPMGGGPNNNATQAVRPDEPASSDANAAASGGKNPNLGQAGKAGGGKSPLPELPNGKK